MTPVDDPIQDEPWRIFRIMAEFVEGFDHLAKLGPVVTIFGSARTRKSDKYYKMTVKTAKLLARDGYGIITGGGPGIMEAANRGATEAGGKSIGLNILLPFEQAPNTYIKTLVSFNYFFVRKVMFMKYAHGLIIMPGGYGTMDEFMEAMTLIQTHKIHKFPVVLMGKEYWGGFVKWLKDTMLKYEYISPEDLNLFHITDDPAEAVEVIKNAIVDLRVSKIR